MTSVFSKRGSEEILCIDEHSEIHRRARELCAAAASELRLCNLAWDKAFFVILSKDSWKKIVIIRGWFDNIYAKFKGLLAHLYLVKCLLVNDGKCVISFTRKQDVT